MSHRTARPQVPPPPTVRSSGGLQLSLYRLKVRLQKRSLLSFLNVYCPRWRPSVLHAAFCGHVKGNRLFSVASGFCTQGKAGVQKSCRRRESERLSMVLYEDPFGGALTTSLRDSWEMEKK
uniref:Uncharacterized protein n=1 Tax=Myotis myotis TaxID=51298 RepID=A0A7J7VYY1_MYOMY|nr:hypothetical protein mMyoMyo1_012211 [Myotis myotis]